MDFRREQILGCLLGGALGDSLGSPHETKTPPFEVGEFGPLTDDTQLTLATCEAIEGPGLIDPGRVAARFLAWFREGRLNGLGSSTLKALRDLEHGAHWALSGREGEHAAGNGAAMRAAPLAFCLDPDDPSQRRTLRDICRITHRNDEAYVGALAIVVAVRESAAGSLHEGLYARLNDRLPDSAVRDRIAELSRVPISVEQLARDFGVSGYVVESVPFAIASAIQLADLITLEALKRVVACGGDCDTTASMTGQILGAAGIPSVVHPGMPWRTEVQRIAEAVADRLTIGPR